VREREHLGEVVVDGGQYQTGVSKSGLESMEWIELAPDKETW